MLDGYRKMVVLMVVILFTAGCTGAAGIRTRAYLEDRERVDQKMDGGNYGYFGGTPVAEDRSEIKKTRKIYVLEFTKDVDEPENVVIEEESSAPRQRPPRTRPDSGYQPIVIPPLDDIVVEEDGELTMKSYTVQKDDTLQKISKKFYGSYSKWIKIYEANKGIIKNPDRIQPGITIQIPVVQ